MLGYGTVPHYILTGGPVVAVRRNLLPVCERCLYTLFCRSLCVNTWENTGFNDQ